MLTKGICETRVVLSKFSRPIMRQKTSRKIKIAISMASIADSPQYNIMIRNTFAYFFFLVFVSFAVSEASKTSSLCCFSKQIVFMSKKNYKIAVLLSMFCTKNNIVQHTQQIRIFVSKISGPRGPWAPRSDTSRRGTRLLRKCLRQSCVFIPNVIFF